MKTGFENIRHADPGVAGRLRVSVIVPAFNAEQTIGACLESLLRQTYEPLEIIVVDDFSQDATSEVAARYGVSLVQLNRNGGPGLARNAGAARARGDVLAFTDADCVAPPDWLERMLEALDAPGVVAVTGGYAGAVQPSFLTRLQHLIIASRQAHLPRTIQSTISSNLVCRASAFRAIGGFPLYYKKRDLARPIWGNEDEEIGFLLAQAGGQIRWIPGVGVYHQFRSSLFSYLRQQRFYARSILVSHLRFPQMARAASNYSRRSGAAQVLAALGTLLGATGAVAAGFCPDEAALSKAVELLCHDLVKAAAFGLLAVAATLYLLFPVPMLAELRAGGQPISFLLRAYPILLAVPMAWLAGAIQGALSGLGGFVDGNDGRRPAPAAANQ